MFNPTIEPFRIKSVDRLKLTTAEERTSAIEAASYNVFKLRAKDVLIDLLTDSGTGAMSATQWAALMQGDESYAGSESFFRFENVVQELTGLPYIIPTHQGRGAESILFAVVCQEGDIVPNNSHFDTTRANVESQGAMALDLPCPEAKDLTAELPFKGNMDIAGLKRAFEEYGRARIPMVMVTVTNNAGGGQPVSVSNLRAVKEICQRYDCPLYLDACRFAENAYFIKLREPEFAESTVDEIVTAMFELADGCTMSAKKDGIVHIGGFFATRNPEVARQGKDLLVLTEGFPTYGGVAGRDLEAMAVGLTEVTDEAYLAYRLASTANLGDGLHAAGIPTMRPPGGHAIYLDAGAFAPHLAPRDLPGVSIVSALYCVGGVRGVEMGTAMFGRLVPETGEEIPAGRELVRLALPRRVYTRSHLDYVVAVVSEVHRQRDALRPFRFTYQAPVLRHFTAEYAPL